MMLRRPSSYATQLFAALAALLLCVASAAAAPEALRKGKERTSPVRVTPAPAYVVAGLTLLTEDQLSRIITSSPAEQVEFPSPTAASPSAAGKAKPTVQPFVDTTKSSDLLLPERPAITPIEPLERPATEIVAGFTYNHEGGFHLNFGYVVPQSPLQEYIAPLGLSLSEEEHSRRIIFGVDISF